jgi:prepilin-type N-terminal cleavage/methylation domain-containing protein
VTSQSQRGFTMLETLLVVGLIGVVGAIAVPTAGNALAHYRVSGDARSLSNAVALTKVRAASVFTQVRLFVDLSGRAHYMQTWDKTASVWKTEGGSTSLSNYVSFGSGVVGAAPPNTQTTIAQAPACKNDAGESVGNTACVIFNSRGVPVDSAGAPTGSDAVYLTDGTSVYGITVSATGMMRTWTTAAQATPAWVLQ